MSKINYLILILFSSSLIFSQENLGVEEITVTGSLVKSNNLESANPIYSISREDLDKSGTFRLEDFLSRLPQIAPSNSALQSGFSTGTASVS